jgi:spermidine/putrescine-binding protein
LNYSPKDQRIDMEEMRMFHRTHIYTLLIVVTIVTLLIPACAPAATETPKTEVEEIEVTRIVAGTPITEVITATAKPPSPFTGTGHVVIMTYGGSWTVNMRKSVHDPFTQETGISVIDATADFSEAQIKAMFEAGNMQWDFAEIQAVKYPEMHEAGMFEKIDYSIWTEEALAGVPEELRLEDAVGGVVVGFVLTYDTRVFPEGTPHPESWADFWDVEKFPGPRGMYAPSGRHNIELALMADGMDPNDIYPLTDEKIERAFEKLDELRPYVAKWWSSGGEPAQLIANGEVVMTPQGDGRARAAIAEGVPLAIVWNQARSNRNWWAIPAGAPDLENAQKYLAYLYQPEVAARFMETVGYAFQQFAAIDYMDEDYALQLPIHPENFPYIMNEDSAWLAAIDPETGISNYDRIQEKWLEWKVAAGIP